jgi:hypothetical protein
LINKKEMPTFPCLICSARGSRKPKNLKMVKLHSWNILNGKLTGLILVTGTRLLNSGEKHTVVAYNIKSI